MIFSIINKRLIRAFYIQIFVVFKLFSKNKSITNNIWFFQSYFQKYFCLFTILTYSSHKFHNFSFFLFFQK